LILWLLIVDKLVAARSSSEAKNGAYATLHIHLSLARIFLYFYFSIFLSALTPFPDKLSAVPTHHP
jgi:hypothetical protein